MPRATGSTRKPSSASAALGFFVVALSLFATYGCGSSNRLTYGELVELIAARDCAAASPEGVPIILSIWRPGDTTYASAGDTQRIALDRRSTFQIGGLTGAFVAEEILARLEDLRLTIDSPVSPAVLPPWPDGTRATYGDLLLHHSGLPPFDPGPPYPTDEELLASIAAFIRMDTSADLRDRYRYDLLNVALAWRSIAGDAHATSPRAPYLKYSDQIDNSTRTALAPTLAPPQPATAVARRSDLLSAVSGGIANIDEVLAFVQRLDTRQLAALPSRPTSGASGDTEVVPGWHRISLRGDRHLYLAAGATSRHAAAAAYYPVSRRGVVAAAPASLRLECLAYHTLRNLTDNWREESPAPPRAASGAQPSTDAQAQ